MAGDDITFDGFQPLSRAVLSERIPDERIHNVRQSKTRIQSFRRAESETRTFAWYLWPVGFSTAPDSQYHAFPDFAGHALCVTHIVGTRRIRYIIAGIVRDARGGSGHALIV